MEDSLKIPKERIAVLIGNNGETRAKVEKINGVKLEIDSKTGEVAVRSKGEGLGFYNALNIIKAIGRGFSPKKALLLSSEEYYLDVIDIGDVVGNSKKEIEIKRGRVIGKEGKAREAIEKETECFVSVFGKTVAIIGTVENVEKARKAVEMLLHGAKHTTAFGFLNRKNLESGKFEL